MSAILLGYTYERAWKVLCVFTQINVSSTKFLAGIIELPIFILFLVRLTGSGSKTISPMMIAHARTRVPEYRRELEEDAASIERRVEWGILHIKVPLHEIQREEEAQGAATLKPNSLPLASLPPSFLLFA